METSRACTAAVMTLLCGLLLAACGGGSSAPAPDPGRLADLDALVTALARHPDPPDVGDDVARLREDAARLDRQEWLVALMRLTATRDRDGHTGLLPLAQERLQLWPLQLYEFDDGWRVVAAQAPLEGLVGQPVERVGGRPVREAADIVAPLVPHDNAATVRARLAQYLVVPDVLLGVGLEPEITVGGRTLRPQPVPAAEYAAWSGAFDPLVVPAMPPPPDTGFGLETRGDAVLLRYSRVVRADRGTTVAQVADRLLAQVAAADARRVVVDLRRNPGGENGSYPPLLAALQHVARERPGALRLLVGRSTFSAATNFVMEVLATTDAVVVGETMGGSPNLWGDADVHVLPSGLRVHVASRWWELGGRDDRAALEPDVVVPVLGEDWAAARDRALEAATAP